MSNEQTSPQTKGRSTKWLIHFVCISLFFVFLTAYTKYIFAKDYDYYIESECDPETTVCYVRDCEDYCPPNGLDTYSAFYISAREFEACTTNECSNVCQNIETAQSCEPIPCDPNEYECTE